ncbi:hypothetical protein PPL_03851 [Heterostelium album PN500]|uniref:B box-type domain-containing protein n=1 Tax=Heterostelium pallidum (strain ATCC 26659 / Pp 5 / PN500) TaxID=670386 RepID=D3B6U3_HETP5|nr:hypothetical protein PPL_03851 [Heterostelium album PN500]EFA83063.1 hypothetical protein PPL_03851 [Heterostelium album PN500]|eukprot:XP_020435180.1 hypothetical protein PPL_03851 [Heterostelium album PN500]
MDNQKDIIKFQCPNHQIVYKIICNQCNKLMCSKCCSDHTDDHSKYYDHIDLIKQSLNNLSIGDIDNNNNTSEHSSNNNNNIKDRLSRLWTKLQSSTTQYQSLESTENEITQHFRHLHDYLIAEEQRLKKPIINSKDIIFNQMDIDINELKHLVNLININNNNNSNNDKDSKEYNNDDPSTNKDITERYQTPTIMESIRLCKTLESFIQENSDSLFDCQGDAISISDQLSYYDNDTDSMILDTIYKYNQQLKSSGTSSAGDYEQAIDTLYKFIVNKGNMNQFRDLYEQTCQLHCASIKTMAIQKSTYLFSTFGKSATIIDISNRDNVTINDTLLNFDSYFTYASIVAVGDIVFIFGGYSQPNKFLRFSMTTKRIDIISDIEVIEGAYGSTGSTFTQWILRNTIKWRTKTVAIYC